MIFFTTFIDHIVISYINKCERLRYEHAHTQIHTHDNNKLGKCSTESIKKKL